MLVPLAAEIDQVLRRSIDIPAFLTKLKAKIECVDPVSGMALVDRLVPVLFTARISTLIRGVSMSISSRQLRRALTHAFPPRLTLTSFRVDVFELTVDAAVDAAGADAAENEIGDAEAAVA